jgi:PAS domain S-box-containing protein
MCSDKVERDGNMRGKTSGDDRSEARETGRSSDDRVTPKRPPMPFLEGLPMEGRPEAPVEPLPPTDRILDDFFDLAPDLFLIVDYPSGKVLKVNQAWTLLLGYTADEMIGLRHILDLLHPDDLKSTLVESAHVFEGRPFGPTFDNRYRHLDGTYRWVRWRAVRRGDCLFCIGRDVTEVRRQEERSREVEELFRVMANELPDPVFLIEIGDGEGEPGLIVYANNAAGRLHRTTGSALTGYKIFDLLPSHEREPAMTRLVEFIAQGPQVFEVDHQVAEGEHVRLEVRTRLVEYGGRRLMLAVDRDITARCTAEEALRQSEELFRLMADELPIGVILSRDVGPADGGPRIEYANAAAAAMHGTTPAGLVGRHASTLIDPKALPEMWAPLASLRETGRSRLVVPLAREDGSRFEAEMISRRVQRNGRPLFLSVYEDVTAKRATERRLKESEQLFRMLFEEAPGPMCLSTPDGTVLKVNKESCAFIGLSKEELEGRNFRSLTHPASLPTNSSHYERLAAGEIDSYRLEVAYVHKDGHTVWGDLQSSRVCGPDDSLDYIVCQMQDITRRREAEHKLRESEQRFRLAFEHAAIGKAIVSLDGHIMEANPALCRFLGYSRTELLGRSIDSITNPDDLLADRAAMNKLIEGYSETYRMDKRFRRKDGRDVWGHLCVVLVRDPLGKPDHFVSQVEDIGARKEAEAALRQSEEQFRKAFELASVGMLQIESDGTIVLTNRAFGDLVGYSPSELKGVNIQSITHPDDLEEDIRRVRLLGSGATTSFSMEKRYLRKDGLPVWALATGAVVRDEEGRVLHFIGQTQDLSRQKAEEAQLRRAREDAEAASRAKSDFLATLSHEIRTPLTAILGFTEILKESREIQTLSPRRQFEFDTVHENANMLLRIMNDLLDLARIEAGKLDLELGPCSPMRLVSDVVAMMHPRARSRGLVLSAECDNEVPVVIQSDETRLRQILINLVGNAIKFTEKGEVRVLAKCVRLGSGERGLEIAVEDTGLGMSPKEVADAFEPFERGKNSQARRAGGAGLGLPICRRLAERLGGTIGVETEPGHGSVFRLVIPIGSESDLAALKGDEMALAASPPEPETWSPSGLRAMLVEDNEANRFMCVYRLEEAGAEVITATNGLEALDHFQEAEHKGEPFDFILMDLQMPVMDGYEACRQLRGLGFDRPLIALTAYAMNEDRDECLRLGFDAHVSKPIDWAKLMERIEALVTGPRVKAG